MTYARLVELIGPDAAMVLVTNVGGQDIPTARQAVRERIVKAFLDGLNPAQVAERFAISRRQAERIRVRVYRAKDRLAEREKIH